MLIPHSESRIINLKVTAAAFIVLGIVVFAVISVFFYASTIYSSRTRAVTERTKELEEMQEGLRNVHQSVTGLRGGAAEFQSELEPALQRLGIESPEQSIPDNSIGDFAELRDLREVSDEDLLESLYVSSVAGMLDDIVDPLKELANRIAEEGEFLTELPVLWPLEGGRGRIHSDWGPSIDPVTGNFSMNHGLIVWDVPGAPVVSSAHGRVSRVDFDPDVHGWFVEVEHGFGFRTRYSHLQQVRVRSGDQVSQGQTVGSVGSTGRAVEPQLGFEIWLGTENVDPDSFLMIRSALGEFMRNDLPADISGR